MKKLLVLAVLLLVSACGIKPTPVIPAGPAPTLRNPAAGVQGTDVVLYFVIDGRVAPVARAAGTPVGLTTALRMLLNGPSRAESSDGYVTMLPAGDPSQVSVDSEAAPTLIAVPFPLRELNSLAMNQLICTATAVLAFSGTATGDRRFTIASPDGKIATPPCQAF